ncbi:SDR family NAD(P)-dependent oxidoreductase [Actinoplanes sp. Pm04-4]|uniref:SDR family NAD(P)-dependent oxidoreductase n=1 Tax=Paractinoplanes pyxinae TaxID=2997416 RepID=A0ABT4BCV1_9ACTN|nr:SDR family NAD(P)-dependent oxidoreductase [Actinoplanes pyxinae]MCY1143650.1 SDR family NAD(P)-dependent oxidoreductase [Actinoplanes pyxinae]
MSRILITGSSTGIGQAAAVALVEQEHEVVLHARNERRAEQALAAVPGAAGAVVADLASFQQTRAMVAEAQKFGRYDTVVLNAGLGLKHATERELTVDGNELMFQVNTLSAYLVAALLPRPRRLIFTSSALASNGTLDLDDPNCAHRPFDGWQVYQDTKFHLILLALGIGRRWSGVESLAFDPGWVSTQMTLRNGDTAPLTPQHAGERLARLATADEVPPDSYDTERAWRPGRNENDPGKQDGLLALCARLTGAALPGS